MLAGVVLSGACSSQPERSWTMLSPALQRPPSRAKGCPAPMCSAEWSAVSHLLCHRLLPAGGRAGAAPVHR